MAVEVHHRFYANANSSEHIFIYHGLFGMSDNWHQIAHKLSASYNVISVDLRNHGKSPHTPEMTYEKMAEDISFLMEKLSLSSAYHIGHSMGGKMVMKFADMYPEKVDKLIVVDISPKGYKPSHTQYFKAFRSLDWSSFGSRKEADIALSELEKNSGVRQFLLKNLTKSEKGYTLRLNVDVIHDFYEEMIGPMHFHAPISIPTLFIRGDSSDYILPNDYKLIESWFKNVVFKNIPNAGHWVHAEQPLETQRAILHFFK